MSFSEQIQNLSLLLLEIGTIIGALGVVLLPNILYSGFLLGGVLICIAGIYLLLNAEFIAAAQVLIYVGAINVIILFAIMLVNKIENLNPSNNQMMRNGLSSFICFSFFILLSNMIFDTQWIDTVGVSTKYSISIIGNHIFSDFLLPFEIVSVLLLVTLVGAVFIARKEDASEIEISKISFLNLPDPSKK
uniref:NAD(P)H-quinone oxidoreductase subunit 6, chloroplastic n=1 Tax=Mesostigma viride TaxID=41882 RepID=NU6C_MESVI|nr:NADH dehydrogenase subunit 6 [Mesostigma viride]Q9MUL3.1 RecName: Full=NAD(P)H-quinone oxidoreductase subunit 6, chloroplastic; AltName: Full=NAD(P)H dehydrogenase subunit 6; AltName: Full=NADH-plastoquinone oxidoreductase subunit 6 [Mesostigma viride]AAF43885.1 subunit 6 of NADH-plastoquinoneoxidoreductase [Mesostigma viride]WKT08240.1 subunit 6 of NADH-plastoquinone oxidoreductase [Mesostigma viride]